MPCRRALEGLAGTLSIALGEACAETDAFPRAGGANPATLSPLVQVGMELVVQLFPVLEDLGPGAEFPIVKSGGRS